MNRPYEQVATRPHACRMAELDLAGFGCTGTIESGDSVVPFQNGVAHYDCVSIEFYKFYEARGDHAGPLGGI